MRSLLKRRCNAASDTAALRLIAIATTCIASENAGLRDGASGCGSAMHAGRWCAPSHGRSTERPTDDHVYDDRYPRPSVVIALWHTALGARSRPGMQGRCAAAARPTRISAIVTRRNDTRKELRHCATKRTNPDSHRLSRHRPCPKSTRMGAQINEYLTRGRRRGRARKRSRFSATVFETRLRSNNVV